MDSSELAAPAGSLHDQLCEIKANIAQYVKPEDRAIQERAIATLLAAGTAAKALPVGASAPAFNLADQNGRMVSSADLLAQGPLIVVFFRGRWCPFCMTSLEAWREVLPKIEAAGAKLVAISPQQVRHNNFTTDQHKLRFPVLSDPGNLTAKAFGIAYRVPEEQESLYRRIFVNLPHLNGDESWELPLPAVFLIGKDGKCLFSESIEDYTVRSEPSKVLSALPQ